MFYDDTMELRDARKAYFDANGFGPDGGYAARWVWFRIGPLPLAFPNFAARRRVVPFHDLNHLATGYPTSLAGEGRIGAFEVGAGCGRYLTAWAFNLAALSWSAIFSPVRSLHAFARGRRSRSLYRHGLDEGLLASTVGTLRKVMALSPEPASASFGERLAFARWVLVSWFCTATPLVLLLVSWLAFRRSG